MKITSVSTVVVNAQMRNWIFVKVATDEGLVGWGEASMEWKTRSVVGAVADYVSVAPHNPLGPIATAVAVQFGFATPNYLIQEAIRSDVPWRDEVVSEPLIVKDGFIYASDKPSLGIEVDEQAAAQHPFKQEVLMSWFHPDGAVADW